MGKFACTCGHVISDIECPNEVTGNILSDKGFHVFADAIVASVQDCFEHFQKEQIGEWRVQNFGDDYPADLTVGDMIEDILSHKLYGRWG